MPLARLLTLWLAAPLLCAANWPQFRGPRASGVAPDGDFPVNFGARSNLLWRSALPGGNSSPVIWNDRIFLTGFENGELETLGIERSSGRVLWKRGVKPGKIERGAHNSHPASSTPCSDGTNVYVYFGSFGALAYDFDGRELWRTPLPVPITQHGASSSPVIAGDLLVLQRDADVDSHLLALRRRDGTIAWRMERPDARRSFCTPLVVDQPNSAPSIIVAGTLRAAAYDAASGKEIWTVHGLPNEMCSSPVAGSGLILIAGWTPGAGVASLPTFAMLLERGDANHDGKLAQSEAPPGPSRQHFQYIDANKDGFITQREWETMAEIFSKAENAALAVRPGGTGDVTRSHVVWKHTRGLPYVPTPLFYQDRVYLLRNGGLLTCLNATNGAPLYQEERIGTVGDYYASPVAAGGKICVFSQSGTATILAAGDELKVLAKNPLGEAVIASPAIAANILYVRTAAALHAFQEQH